MPDVLDQRREPDAHDRVAAVVRNFDAIEQLRIGGAGERDDRHDSSEHPAHRTAHARPRRRAVGSRRLVFEVGGAHGQNPPSVDRCRDGIDRFTAESDGFV